MKVGVKWSYGLRKERTWSQSRYHYFDMLIFFWKVIWNLVFVEIYP